MSEIFKLVHTTRAELLKSARTPLFDHINGTQGRRMLMTPDESWTQGSYKDLFDGRLQNEFRGTLDAFYKSAIITRLKTKAGLIKPKRRRCHSAYDGEFNFDRVWDHEPFDATTKVRSNTRTVTILFNFSFSAHVKSEEINRYGAFLVAINDLITSAGIQTEIIQQIKARRVSKDLNMDLRINIKKSTEYLSNLSLSNAFTANFYRRVLLCELSRQCSLKNKTVHTGHGSPVVERNDAGMVFKDGTLVIGPHCQMDKFSKWESELMRCLT